ncbi:hypothetical protein [Amycolatopsis japonica]
MLTSPPKSDEIEVSIFGPGKGESVAVHLGCEQWIIVDSCVDQADKRIPVIEYLNRIGVNLADDVKLVVGTHAHDDHIAGISEVLSQCESALFVASSAITSEEFMATIEIDVETEKLLRKGIRSEYRRVLGIVEERFNGRTGRPSMRHAIEGRALYQDISSGDHRILVRSLSPSDHAVTRSRTALARDLAKTDDRQRLGSADPNELAVALWVEAGDKRVLLGADLLKGPAGCGWQAILDSFEPDLPASVYKVPHHGAPNAHHLKVWEQLLGKDPVALIAPYRAGVTPRPSEDDIARINSLTPRAYITASPSEIPKSNSVRKSAAVLNEIARNVRDPWGKSGHVRARSKIGQEEWQIEMASPARKL